MTTHELVTLKGSVATEATEAAFVALPNLSGNTTGYYSTDGITWSTSTLPTPSSGTWLAPASNGDGSMIVIMDRGTQFAYSTDGGATWTVSGSTHTSSTMDPFIHWSEAFGKFYTGRDSNFTGYQSTDGITWSTFSFAGQSLNRSTIISNSTGLFAVPDGNISASTRIPYSTDGATWQWQNLPLNINFKDGAASPGMFVLVGSNNDNNYLYSSDLVTWTTGTLPEPEGAGVAGNWKVLWDGEQFVAERTLYNGEYDDLVALSTDGISWTTVTSSKPLTNTPGPAVSADGNWFAADRASNLHYASNIEGPWTTITPFTENVEMYVVGGGVNADAVLNTGSRLTPNGTHSGMDITIQNINQSANVFLGGEGVTTANYGYKIVAGAAWSVELSGQDDIYAISDTDESKVAVFKVSLED